jgi:hypothetical protein
MFRRAVDDCAGIDFDGKSVVWVLDRVQGNWASLLSFYCLWLLIREH